MSQPAAKDNQPLFPGSPSTSSVTLLGLTFWVACGWAMNARALFPFPGAAAYAAMRSIDILYVGVWVLSLFTMGLLARRVGPLHSKKVMLFGMPVLLCAGMITTILSGWGESINHVGLIFGAPMQAMGSAGLVVMWGEIYALADLKKATSAAAASFALASPVAFLVTNLRPTAALVVVALLPLCSGAVLWFTPGVLSRTAPSATAIPGRSRILYKWLLGAVAVGFAFGLSNGLTRTEESSLFNTYYLLSSGVMALLIFLLITVHPRSLDFGAGYRFVAPLMVSGLLLMSLPGARYLAMAQLVIAASWVLIRILTWIILSDLTSRLRMPATRTFAWTLASLSAGREIGWLLSKDATETPGQVALVVAGGVLLVVLTATLLFSERDVMTIFGKSSSANADADAVWRDAAASIAATYELSPKQQQVVSLLIQGYDNVAIQKTLYIAGSTLKAHLRDIYAKTGVHSRQALLALCTSYIQKL